MKASARWILTLTITAIVIAFAFCGCASDAELLLKLKTVDDAPAQHEAAVELASRHSVTATQDLAAAAKSSSVATAGLAALRDEYIAALGSTLSWDWTDSFTEEQVATVDCLAAVGDSIAAKALIGFAFTGDLGPEEVRLRALKALDSFDDSVAMPELAQALTSELALPEVYIDEWRSATIAYLAARASSAPALVEAVRNKLLYEGEYELWQTVEQTLVALGGSAAEATAPFVGEDWADSVLQSIGVPAIPAIAAALEGPDQAAAAKALEFLLLISGDDEAMKSVVVPYLAKSELVPLLLGSQYCRASDEYFSLSAPVFGSAMEIALLQIGEPAVNELVDRGVGLLDETAKWTGQAVAIVIYELITRYPAATVTQVLVEKVTEDAEDRLRTLFLAVKLGTAGSQGALIQALDEYGDKAMAEDYLNCGSAELSEAAERWATNHGYYVSSDGGGSHRATWGAF
jgi:hypothetical protein